MNENTVNEVDGFLREDEMTVTSLWTEIQGDLSNINFDLARNARGSHAAGVRARKMLRAVRTKIHTLVKLTLVVDKEKKQPAE